MSPRLRNSRKPEVGSNQRSAVGSEPRNVRQATPPEIDACVLFRNLPGNCGLGAADRRAIRKYASQLNLDVAAGRGFDCLMTNDEHLRALNHQFRGHDYATDVLSFPSGAACGAAGELAISIERAAAQGREFGHSTMAEIQILMLHGVLHLIGHDHEQDRGEMRGLERALRLAYGLPPGLIGRRVRRASGWPKASPAGALRKPRSRRLPQ